MKVIKCEIGHYYDWDKYGSCCPHCEELNKNEMRVTTLVTEASDGQGVILPVTEEISGTVTRYSSFDEDDILTQKWYTADTNQEPVAGWLVCVKGKELGKSYNLKIGRNFIGRGNDMDVVIADKTVSRNKHAIVTYEPRNRMFFIQPGESSELFYVNQQVVLNTIQLNSYDRISIGEVELMFVPFCCEIFAWEETKDEIENVCG